MAVLQRLDEERPMFLQLLIRDPLGREKAELVVGVGQERGQQTSAFVPSRGAVGEQKPDAVAGILLRLNVNGVEEGWIAAELPDRGVTQKGIACREQAEEFRG